MCLSKLLQIKLPTCSICCKLNFIYILFSNKCYVIQFIFLTVIKLKVKVSFVRSPRLGLHNKSKDNILEVLA